ncbi:hypothetical protein PHMEG_0007963 [Phytophthora megakarya]|uniref:C3H1-type domain-containing protein n=1 Tax=Phytophthora megakarya TaxID=4795 RepID=A0A225WK63_9STRA|nr:hypothetical protein PHMEG_0007963 [Phytophthora megakarya]
MSRPIQVDALAFLVVSITDDTAEAKVMGPDEDTENTTFEIPTTIVGFRLVPESERTQWPGSYVSFPVAFVRTSDAGVDEWSYGVVSGYTASDTTGILHISCSDEPARFPLTNVESIIKVDPLNYALRPGQGSNVAAVNPMELPHRQDNLLATCGKRKNGIPDSVMANLSVPYHPEELVPLVKPSTLALVHDRRQHIVNFSTANRPQDLYQDSGVVTITDHPLSEQNTRRAQTAPPTTRRSDLAQAAVQLMGSASSADEQHYSFSDNDENDIREVQHMNVPLSKRRRIDYFSDCDSDASNPDHHQGTQREIVFHPPPTDRRIHAAIVNRQHTGKEPHTLLQSVQQSPHVEFVASPATLRERISNSSKASNFADVISSLSALHKFGQYLYNNDTVEFISAAKDFIINYSDHARPDPAMARLLAYWINCKLILFRSTVLVASLNEATKVSAQFCRSDDKLAALRDSSQSWKPLSTPVRLRTSDRDKVSRGQRAKMTSCIHSEVFSRLPKGEDGRRVCLKFLSKSGCKYANCSNSHFRPESLPDGARKIIEER